MAFSTISWARAGRLGIDIADGRNLHARELEHGPEQARAAAPHTDDADSNGAARLVAYGRRARQCRARQRGWLPFGGRFVVKGCSFCALLFPKLCIGFVAIAKFRGLTSSYADGVAFQSPP